MLIEKLILTGRPSTEQGYVLPFRGSQVEITQGYNGRYSHLATKRSSDHFSCIEDDRFSLDFLLPEGTAVVAPKAGKIVSSIDEIDGYYEGLVCRLA